MKIPLGLVARLLEGFIERRRERKRLKAAVGKVVLKPEADKPVAPVPPEG